MIPGDATAIGPRPEFPPSEPRLEVDDDAIEVEGAGTEDDDAEIREAVAQVLADAASFRRVRLLDKALESLQTGLELDPMSREVHEASRDVLVEMGNYAEAAGHVVVIAGMQLEAGDVENAVQGLYDALSLSPGMTQAAEMLQSLGYQLPDYADGTAGAVEDQSASEVPETYSDGIPGRGRPLPGRTPPAGVPAGGRRPAPAAGRGAGSARSSGRAAAGNSDRAR